MENMAEARRSHYSLCKISSTSAKLSTSEASTAFPFRRTPEMVGLVAYDAAAGEFRPFGKVMLRRRKHGIDQAVRDVPLGLFCFELL